MELLSPFRLSVVEHTQHSMTLFCAVYATKVLTQNVHVGKYYGVYLNYGQTVALI